ncbi:unnamed protein product, partial [Iphiclides podalirius]
MYAWARPKRNTSAEDVDKGQRYAARRRIVIWERHDGIESTRDKGGDTAGARRKWLQCSTGKARPTERPLNKTYTTTDDIAIMWVSNQAINCSCKNLGPYEF